MKRYKLPEGWKPIETVPIGVAVNVLYYDGHTHSCTFADRAYIPNPIVAWQPIVPVEVEEVKPRWTVEGGVGWRGCILKDTDRVAGSYLAEEYGSMDADRAVAQAACDKANEVCP